MNLAKLVAPKGSRKKRKRLGRGEASGRGKTAGRGHKGQGSRSGKKISAHFEGGQMPLIRRLPKFGFTNIHRKLVTIINLRELNQFEDGQVIDLQFLQEKGLVRKKNVKQLKVLGQGEMTKKLTVKATAFSNSAKQAIEKAGGKAEVISNHG